jgi:sentrin-specific protease 8
LGPPMTFIHLPDSPLQDNGIDYEAIVCLNMRHRLLRRLLSVPSDKKVSMSLDGVD